MPVSFSRIISGISDYNKEEPQPDGVAFIRHVDYRRDPRRWALLPEAQKESGSTVTDLPKWGERISDTVYVYGDSGNIYTRSLAGSVALGHSVPGSHGNGLKYFGEDGFLYYTTDTVIGRYGRIGSSPIWVDDFLGAQGGIPTNTRSLDLEAASSQYATAADSASLSITGDITLETLRKPESLPTSGNEMVLISKWNENSNQRSYKWSLYNAPLTAKILVIGGGAGGGGASNNGGAGGGGAGGFIYNATYSLAPGTYPITVGAGGGGGTAGAGANNPSGGNGGQGGNSIFNDQTAVGAGFGGSQSAAGAAGGSGGGGGSSGSTGGGLGTAGQGNNGAAGVDATRTGGGGGGAGGAASGKTGGVGTANSISGSSVTYAVGGNGGDDGGTGSGSSIAGSGGGGARGNGAAGVDGKNGTVVIRYTTGEFSATGGTITTDGNDTIHTFTSSGSFVVGSSATAYKSRLTISSNGTNTETYDKALSSILVGAWIHLAVSLDVSASLATFYESGANSGTATGALTAIFNSTALLAIGASFDAAAAAEKFYDGLTDENRVWAAVRADSDIILNKDRELAGTDPNLVGYYQHDNALTDDSPQTNTLTLVNTPVYSSDVPFAGATTRTDKDQSAAGTGNTYALLTAISEAETDKQTFVPAKDPQKSISVYVAATGTGDWTLTVHDAQNRLITSKTILNAALPAAGEVEFIFATPWTPIIGATYHFHLTSTVANATIVSVASNDIETAQFNSYYQFLVTDSAYHPIGHIINLMTIGNGRYVATWDGGTYDPHTLVLPSEWKVRCLAKWREYEVYGCVRGDSIESYDEGVIFFWDGTSDTYNFFITVPEGGISAMFGSQGTLTIIAGYQGEILEYTGGDKASKVKTLPQLDLGKQIEVHPGGITMWQTLIRIGAGVTDSATFEQGVYTWGRKNDNYPMSLSYDYKISTGDNQSSSIAIGMLLPVEKKLLIGWQNGVSYGLDVIDPTHTSFQDGSIEFLIRDEGGIWKEKLTKLLRVEFEPLISGHTVGLQYKLDRESSWVTEETETTVGKDFKRMQVKGGRHKEYQARVNFRSSTTSSPAVLGVTVDEDILSGEKKI